MAISDALDEAEHRSPATVVVLDAGCGRKSPLVRFRGRIDRLVGVDLHEPDPPLAYLDEFVVVDLCGPGGNIPDDAFDLILSHFTLEHLADPSKALKNMHRWLRPGGTLVLTTVNRRNPFVAAYLGLPRGLQRRIQPLVKARLADAHPLVGACNDPDAIRSGLSAAGFGSPDLEMVPNLARAWSRRLWTFAIGAVGDVVTMASASRRSTILAVARK